MINNITMILFELTKYFPKLIENLFEKELYQITSLQF